MKHIEFAGHRLTLDPSGVLLWPSKRTAIVSDLHLEKASYFAVRGQLLPPYDSVDTLRKLLVVLQDRDIDHLILLGDSFHDADGYYRLDKQAHQLFSTLCQNFKVTWVIGNHDNGFVPPDTTGVDEITIEDIVFRHEALPGETQEISGHYHPKAELRLRGSRVARPCFVMDDHRIILPAFGTLTGGLNINHEVFQKLFTTRFTAYLLGEDRIYVVPADRLSDNT